MYMFFFFISNKILLIRKQETPKHTGSIQGRANQERKLQKSSKSKREKEKNGFSIQRTIQVRFGKREA